MSGHVITKPMQDRHSDLCADLVGVLQQMVGWVEDKGALTECEWCAGCRTVQPSDAPCQVCASRRVQR